MHRMTIFTAEGDVLTITPEIARQILDMAIPARTVVVSSTVGSHTPVSAGSPTDHNIDRLEKDLAVWRSRYYDVVTAFGGGLDDHAGNVRRAERLLKQSREKTGSQTSTVVIDTENVRVEQRDNGDGTGTNTITPKTKAKFITHEFPSVAEEYDTAVHELTSRCNALAERAEKLEALVAEAVNLLIPLEDTGPFVRVPVEPIRTFLRKYKKDK